MPRRYRYPENLLSALHLNEETQRTISYDELTDDQRKGLEYALSALSEREQIVLRHHFCEGIGYKAIGLHITSRRAERGISSEMRCAGCTKILRGCTTSQTALKREPHICGSSSKRRNKSIVNAAAFPLRQICIIRGWKPCNCLPNSAIRLAGTI